jgi:hypothetical protein
MNRAIKSTLLLFKMIFTSSFCIASASEHVFSRISVLIIKNCIDPVPLAILRLLWRSIKSMR